MGGRFFIENPRAGGAGGRGPGGCLRGLWGGGAKYFFSGPKSPPRIGQISGKKRRTCRRSQTYYPSFFLLE